MQDLYWLSRTTLLIGEENIEKLQNSHVLIVGLGGVGSFAAEAICRSGIGTMTIVDGDVVDPSNRNRQLPALATTHGLSKADVMAERLIQINPKLNLNVLKEFLQPEPMRELLNNQDFDYVIDAIDSLTPKLMLIEQAVATKTKIVCSMGAGGKLDPSQVKVSNLFETHTCNLAAYVRKRLRPLGIDQKAGIKAVFSTEEPDKASLMFTDGNNFKKSAFGTISYLPAIFGLTCASVVIRELIESKH